MTDVNTSPWLGQELTYDFNLDGAAQAMFDSNSPQDRTLFVFEAVKLLQQVLNSGKNLEGQADPCRWVLADNLDFCFGNRVKIIDAPLGYIPPIYLCLLAPNGGGYSATVFETNSYVNYMGPHSYSSKPNISSLANIVPLTSTNIAISLSQETKALTMANSKCGLQYPIRLRVVFAKCLYKSEYSTVSTIKT